MRVKLEKPYLNEFFDIIQKDKDFQSWTAFSKKLKTTTRWSLKQIRNGTWTFSEETFYELLQVIVPNKQEYFRNKIKYLESDWWPKLRWKKKQCTVKEQLKTKNKPFQLELKARLWGYLAGDGSVFIIKEENQKSNGYNVAFYPDDLEMAKCFQEAFLEIYNKIWK